MANHGVHFMSKDLTLNSSQVFMKLTNEDGGDEHVRLDALIRMGTEHSSYTWISLSGSTGFFVKETPEEIFARMDEAYRELSRG